MARLSFCIRAAVAAALCLVSAGCAVGPAFVGPPFDYVPDYAAVPPPAPGTLLISVPPPGWS